MAKLVTCKILRTTEIKFEVTEKQIKFIAETQYYACWETHLWVATVYL